MAVWPIHTLPGRVIISQNGLSPSHAQTVFDFDLNSRHHQALRVHLALWDGCCPHKLNAAFKV